MTDFCKEIFIIYYYNSLSLIKNEKNMINQKLSILIILYERKLKIIKCLEKSLNFKIIIIDNANDKFLKNEIIKKKNI